MNKRARLNVSFALIWVDFPVLYYAAVTARDPVLTAAALALMALAVLVALFT
ncbi:MAG: hypothetical protein ACYC3S_13820 [Chloroflexota bacterium]